MKNPTTKVQIWKYLSYSDPNEQPLQPKTMVLQLLAALIKADNSLLVPYPAQIEGVLLLIKVFLSSVKKFIRINDFHKVFKFMVLPSQHAEKCRDHFYLDLTPKHQKSTLDQHHKIVAWKLSTELQHKASNPLCLLEDNYRVLGKNIVIQEYSFKNS